MSNPFLKYKDKLLVIVHPSCPHCEDLKRRMPQDEEFRKNVVFLDVTKDEEAQLIADAFDVREVPSLFFVTEEEGKVKVCRLDDKMEKIEECVEVERAEGGQEGGTERQA